jgi:hypothetical protein
MQKTTLHLNDEHMRLYEWSAAGSETVVPARSKSSHSWHASYGVLAVLTSLLVLSGCNNKASTEHTEQAALEMKEAPGSPLYDEAQPAPAEAGAPAAEGMDEPAAENAGQAGGEIQP